MSALTTTASSLPDGTTLSIPLCLVALFKALDENGSLKVVNDPVELAKLASISNDLIKGLAPTLGNGPLASTAASVKSFISMGKVISACSAELRHMCERTDDSKDVSSTAQTDELEQRKMLDLALVTYTNAIQHTYIHIQI
jgi:hypothetical protein